MKLEKDRLKLGKILTKLDKAVLKFAQSLEPLPYVIVSGYVSILLGRSRGTEDIDLIIPRLSFEGFKQIYRKLVGSGYWCLNSGDTEELYASFLVKDLAIRFAQKDLIIPNFEMRFAKDEVDRLALEKRLKVETSEGILYISPIEMQIAYKRHVLGTEKDIEDAVHLEEVFKGQLDKESLENWSRKLKAYAKQK